MRKLFVGALVPLAMLVAACGDNGVRSPDFDAVLIDILVDGPSQRTTEAPNNTAQFRALGHFTTPPSTQGAISTSDITTDSQWQAVVPISSPGGTTPDEACRLSSTDASNIARSVGNGLFEAKNAGTVYIKATFRGKSGCKPFTVVAGGGDQCNVANPPAGCPVCAPSRIEITPDSQVATPGQNTPSAYHPRAFFGNDSNPHEISTDHPVTWTTGNSNIATAQPVPGSNDAFAHGAAGVTSEQSTSITASASFNCPNGTVTVSDSATVIVRPAQPQTVLRVVPSSATIQVGTAQEFIACGTFNPPINDPPDQPADPNANPPKPAVDSVCDVPGRPSNEPIGHPIDDSVLDWTSSDITVATISDETGVATGVAPGTVTITARLEENVGDPAGQRSATASLTVTPLPLCTIPYLFGPGTTDGNNAIADDETPSQLCLGCTVQNPGFTIDEAPKNPPDNTETFTEIDVSAALLDLLGLGHTSMVVKAPHTFSPNVETNPDDEGTRAGFIIQRPVSDLALAEVLAQTSIETTLGTQTQETFGPNVCNPTATGCVPGGSSGDTIAVELLGGVVIPPGIPPTQERALIYTPHVTKPYNGLRLIFGGGVAAVLTTLDVFNACAVVTLPPEVENPPATP